jgi:hypothetical protein
MTDSNSLPQNQSDDQPEVCYVWDPTRFIKDFTEHNSFSPLDNLSATDSSVEGKKNWEAANKLMESLFLNKETNKRLISTSTTKPVVVEKLGLVNEEPSANATGLTETKHRDALERRLMEVVEEVKQGFYGSKGTLTFANKSLLNAALEEAWLQHCVLKIDSSSLAEIPDIFKYIQVCSEFYKNKEDSTPEEHIRKLYASDPVIGFLYRRRNEHKKFCNTKHRNRPDVDPQDIKTREELGTDATEILKYYATNNLFLNHDLKDSLKNK